jgi:8-oxo-dGTP diphosphatase
VELSVKPPENLPRVGSAALVTDNGRILLGVRVKEPNKGKWVIPGGKVRPFESYHDAASREIREETGLEVKVDGVVGVYEIIRPQEEHRLIVYSWAHLIGGELKASDDIAEVRFFSREEIQQLVLAGQCSEIVAQVLRDVGWT